MSQRSCVPSGITGNSRSVRPSATRSACPINACVAGFSARKAWLRSFRCMMAGEWSSIARSRSSLCARRSWPRRSAHAATPISSRIASAMPMTTVRVDRYEWKASSMSCSRISPLASAGTHSPAPATRRPR
ncbi:hypothetical protein D9M68_816530 [compost metagenome]